MEEIWMIEADAQLEQSIRSKIQLIRQLFQRSADEFRGPFEWKKTYLKHSSRVEKRSAENTAQFEAFLQQNIWSLFHSKSRGKWNGIDLVQKLADFRWFLLRFGHFVLPKLHMPVRFCCPIREASSPHLLGRISSSQSPGSRFPFKFHQQIP